MNRNVAAASVLIASLIAGVEAQEANPIELAFEGSFPGSGPFPESGDGWFAVVPTATGLELIETGIGVEDVPPICGDQATRIAALDVSDPLFLVRGSPYFTVGPLDSVVEDRRFIYPAEYVSFQLASGRHFGFRAFGSAVPADTGQAIDDYMIYLDREGRRQILAEFARIGLDGPPQLVWAGDLDRDGEPDALFDLARTYVGNHFVLFLSTSATTDQLVERVSEYRVSGC